MDTVNGDGTVLMMLHRETTTAIPGGMTITMTTVMLGTVPQVVTTMTGTTGLTVTTTTIAMTTHGTRLVEVEVVVGVGATVSVIGAEVL